MALLALVPNTDPPAPFRSARLSPADEMDLRWYLTEMVGTLGMRSWLGPLLERAQVGQLFTSRAPHDGDPLSERVADALKRGRRIRARLEQIPSDSRAILAAVYGAPPHRELRELDRLANVALMSSEARTGYQRAQDRAVKKLKIGGVLELPTYPRWLSAALKVRAEFRAKVLLEADAILTGAVLQWQIAFTP